MHRMGNALGQGDFGQVHVGATDQLSQVNFNELGQVGGQAGYFQFGKDMADDLATDLDGGGYIAIDDVLRQFRRKGLRCLDALEVDVQDLLLVGVPLHAEQ